MSRFNEYGQPVGESMVGWTARPEPGNVTSTGRTCRLEPLDASKHADELHAAYSHAPDDRDWTYLMESFPRDINEFRENIEKKAKSADPKFYTVIDLASEKAVGIFSLFRIQPEHGVIEVGHVNFSRLIKQSAISTEAQFLLMKYAFDELGYRRYEWKCDSLHALSRKAALRLGFQFEGIFRNGSIYKDRSRGIAWFSIIDDEWPAVKAAIQSWIAPGNFDNEGKQIKSLTAFREE